MFIPPAVHVVLENATSAWQPSSMALARMSRAPSDDGPPARRQRTLLGFLKMSSLTRHSLEQIEVAAGTLAPEQTRNHQVWGPLALYSASPEALLKAKIGKFEYLTKGKIFQDLHRNRETWA